MARRDEGGGYNGEFLFVTATPDSTLKSNIDTMILNEVAVEGIKVQFTTSANFQVQKCAEDAKPDGEIVAKEGDASDGYKLTIRVFGYTHGNGFWYAATRIVHTEYAGSVSLGDAMVNGTATAGKMKGTGTPGIGKVLNVDVPSASECDFIL